MWLQISNYIPLNVAILISIIMGLALLLLEINRIEKRKQKAGKILFFMESDWKASPIIALFNIILALIVIVISALTILSSRIPSEYVLYYAITIYLLVSELYMIFNVKSFLTENGVFISGKIIKWAKIKGYNWKEPHFKYQKGYTTLLLSKEDRLWITELKLTTNNSQKLELEELLQHMKVKEMSGSTNVI